MPRLPYERTPARLCATLAVFAASLLSPGLAQATSSVTSVTVPSGDLVVDKPAVISAAGLFDPTQAEVLTAIWVQVNPSTEPCLQTAPLNEPRDTAKNFDETYVDPGPFTDARVKWTPRTAGKFLFCTYLGGWSTAKHLAAHQLAVTVRPPNSSLALSLPGSRFEAGETVPLQITAFAEVERKVSVAINPIGVPCGVNAKTNQARRAIDEPAVLGGPETTFAELELPPAGHHRLCGWVGKDEYDASPTSRFDGFTFWTGPEPTCRVGAAPASPTGRVRVWCAGVDGSIHLQAHRGSRIFSAELTLSGGAGYVRGRQLGLKRGSRVAVSVEQEGTQLGSRVLRVRSNR